MKSITFNGNLIIDLMSDSFSSLDRKSQKNKLKKQLARNVNQPTKSTSLSSFNFINKTDDTSDTNMSANNAQNDPRRLKEKQWYNFSFDSKELLFITFEK